MRIVECNQRRRNVLNMLGTTAGNRLQQQKWFEAISVINVLGSIFIIQVPVLVPICYRLQHAATIEMIGGYICQSISSETEEELTWCSNDPTRVMTTPFKRYE